MRVHSWVTGGVVVALAITGCAGGGSVGTAGTSGSIAVTAAPEPGASLQWESVLKVDGSYVTSLAATPVGTFVVAAPIRARQCDAVSMWSDVAGTALVPVDVDTLFGQGASIMQVVAGGPGAVAAGCLPDPDRLVVWTSSDGAAWTASETGYRMPEGDQRFWVGSLAATSDRAILAGDEFTDIQAYADTIEKAATKRMPDSLRPYVETSILVEPQRASMAVGPFTAWSATLDELGVDPSVGSDYTAAMSGGAGAPVTITTDDYREWTVSRERPVPDAPNASIVATSDGFLASAWNDMTTAPIAFASTDGSEWRDVAAPVTIGSVYLPTSDAQRILLTSESQEEGIGLWETSDLGSTWTALEPTPVGFRGTPAVGPMGYLAAMNAEGPQGRPIEFSFEQGSLALTMTLGMDAGSVRLVDGGTTLVDDEIYGNWRMPTAPASLVFDNDAGELVVVDQANGDEFMRVPYSDVQASFDAAVRAAGVGTVTAAFSADGRSWSHAQLPVLPDRFGGAGPVAVGQDAAWVAASRAYGVSEVVRGTLP